MYRPLLRAGKIWHLRRQKFVCLKVVLSFFEFFKNLWDFNGENTLFTKSAQKWSSFRKKILYFFHNKGGGGSRPLYGIFNNLKKIEPFPY